jgi:hypothetical protein
MNLILMNHTRDIDDLTGQKLIFGSLKMPEMSLITRWIQKNNMIFVISIHSSIDLSKS